MRNNKKRAVRIAGGAFAMLLLSAAVLTAQSAGSASTSKPVRGGTLVMDRAADIFNFDPTNAPDQYSASTEYTLYDRLVQLDPRSNKILPDLATTWKTSNHGRTVVFSLRKGVRFSDGSALTADDVVYSIKKASGPNNSYSALWGGAVSAVTKIDPYTVKISLKRPFAPLLTTLATFDGSIYSAANDRKWGKQGPLHPLGSGPFMLQSWQKGNQLTLVRNPYYWHKGRPYLDKVIFRVVGDDSARALQLRSGAADVIDTVAPNQAKTLSSGSRLINILGQSVLLIPLNENVKPLQDVNVRLALAYALDRPSIAKDVYFGLAQPAKSVLPSTTLFYRPTYAIPYDLARAKAYLTKSSVPNGFSFAITIPSGNSAYSAIAQIWSSSLAKIGVTASITPIEATTAFDRWVHAKYDAYMQAWANDTPDPMEFTALALAGTHAWFTNYTNPALASLKTRGESSLTASQRAKVYAELQLIAARDVPQVPVVTLPVLFAASSHVHGLAIDKQQNYHFESAWKG